MVQSRIFRCRRASQSPTPTLKARSSCSPSSKHSLKRFRSPGKAKMGAS